MTKTRTLLSLAVFFLLAGVGHQGPGPLGAQEAMGDFLFHAPKATFSFTLGYGMPRAGSDLFQEADEVYTLDKSDFFAPSVGGGISFFLNDRTDLAFELSFARSSKWSEYVDWVDDNDLPIEQETKFTRVPLTASVRYFLMDRGREIGSLSWIPTTWAPYIGAGGGRMYYEFQQTGDFVDFVDLSIFSYSYESQGWAWVGHLFGGVQWTLSPQWVVTAEGRYSLANAEMDRPAYGGYEPIDLSGLQGTIGFGIRF